jgi:signal transduction histidine kinase
MSRVLEITEQHQKAGDFSSEQTPAMETHWILGYLIASAATLLMTVLRVWLDPVLGDYAPFQIYYVTVIFTAWYCGFGPAIFSLVMGIFIASYLFDDTRGSLLIYPFRNQLSCGIYSAIGTYLAYLINWLTRDIARRKKVERDLRRSQEQLQVHQNEFAHVSRLNVMGEMVASLAHELNQPLYAAKNYARGSIHRLHKNSNQDGELLTALQRISDEADRAAEILRRVRDFVQKSGPRESRFSINDLVRDAVALSNLVPKQVRAGMVCELDADLPPVTADPVQIEQVIVNLARNGVESMQDMPEENRILNIGTRRSDECHLEVFVRDCGRGIGEENKRRVFEPFFTTKSEGMGMGLAISRSIIERHEGRLWVTENEDRGCTFHFTLPFKEN